MPDPVIELEPKNPFRWTVVLGLVALWAVVLVLAIYLKSGVLRLLLPVILVIALGYLAFCTLYLLRHRR